MAEEFPKITTMALPDFLKMSEEDIAREKSRQIQLFRDFNSRARLSPLEQEFSSAMIVETSVRESLRSATERGESDAIGNRLADIVASQGRFGEAAQLTTDEIAKRFFERMEEAVFTNKPCSCAGLTASVGTRRIRLPKYRVIKEAYSLKTSQFGYISECSSCEIWVFLGSDPRPRIAEGSDLDILQA